MSKSQGSERFFRTQIHAGTFVAGFVVRTDAGGVANRDKLAIHSSCSAIARSALSGSRFFRTLEVHSQIAVKAELVLPRLIIIRWALLGVVKADLRPYLSDTVWPPGDGDGVLGINIFDPGPLA